ncbi:oligopeptide ABC transporter substrate-binding protein [Alkalihalobacillus pseudalcaliphilus]|uniref:oligopeptide ABC transporter substrate-binding protein n=1 Tax=Alkalihalobacillus pseudalcaliphilus TaxID=79884 RepID=UPI00064DCF93|nr:oligopeptide ABC transporter substrate-binding protein [Alkalihalobacillus pseudalcaliphilus]KMK77416.1 ABC transporter substrate-binding protein [Alkalihalobacillus pseudalcaliphilus]
MSQSKFRFLFLALLAGFVLFMAACSDNGTDSEPGNANEDPDTEDPGSEEEEDNTDGLYSIDDFDQTKTGGDIIDGGSLTYGLSSSDPFEGTLNWVFYSGTYDAEILNWFSESMFTWDETFVYTNDGAATYEIDPDDNRVITLTIKDNVNWHDGEPVTAEDWAFAYEVIAHPDYDAERFNATVRNVEGIMDYHNGEADSISGLEIIDEKTLRVTFVNATPSLVTGGIWSYPLAKHIYGDIEVADMSAHDATRVNPIGYGPYVVDSIVPGESVTLTKNEDYWRGEPALDNVTLRVVNPNVAMEALRSGEIDMINSFPADQYADNVDATNIDWLGTTDRAYTYIGFKLGKWDTENNVVAYDPENSKMGSKELRQAMWHAVDNNAVGEQFYDGLRWAGTTLIPPSHSEYHDATNPGREYNPDLANQLLDDAGFVDVDGDGFREDQDGNELTINFASMEGGDIAEPLSYYYIQAWEEVGLRVQLTDGRLQEFNTFYERVQNDDEAIDIYQGAWGVGIDVNPLNLYGPEAAQNYSRYATDENTELLLRGISDEAFDVDYRIDVYNEWQELMVEEVPVFPTVYRAILYPVNKRVTNAYIGDGTGMYRYQIGVTEDSPVVDGQ